MKESAFQLQVKREIEERLPGAIVVKNGDGCPQGFPDLTVYYGERWAALECKRSRDAEKQPNQEWYVDRLNRMGFARIVYPENRTQVLDELVVWLDI